MKKEQNFTIGPLLLCSFILQYFSMFAIETCDNNRQLHLLGSNKPLSFLLITAAIVVVVIAITRITTR